VEGQRAVGDRSLEPGALELACAALAQRSSGRPFSSTPLTAAQVSAGWRDWRNACRRSLCFSGAVIWTARTLQHLTVTPWPMGPQAQRLGAGPEPHRFIIRERTASVPRAARWSPSD